MVKLALLAIGVIGMIVGFFLQVVGMGRKTDEAPSCFFLSPKFYFVGSEKVRSWFETDRAYRQVRWGAVFYLIGALSLVFVFWFLT